MNRIFVDMDGVVVDFDGYKRKHQLTAAEVCVKAGAFRSMEPMPYALDSLLGLHVRGWQVWLATMPPDENAFALADKALWIDHHIPKLTRRLITTYDKGLLGDAGDYLIDDRLHAANCMDFKGQIIEFRIGFAWPEIMRLFAGRNQQTT